MYQGDSFFTLSQSGQFGLVVLSVGLCIVTLVILWGVAQNWPILFRLFSALLLFYAFTWLAPQVYYQYYRILIDGLPAQWVIGWPPSVLQVPNLLTFRAEANLSNHAQGALGWALVVLAILRRRPSLA